MIFRLKLLLRLKTSLFLNWVILPCPTKDESRRFLCLLVLILAAFINLQAREYDWNGESLSHKDVENLVRYSQRPLNMYWGDSFGSTFYYTAYGDFPNHGHWPHYGGYNYPYDANYQRFIW